jgi:hypothetical protein
MPKPDRQHPRNRFFVICEHAVGHGAIEQQGNYPSVYATRIALENLFAIEAGRYAAVSVDIKVKPRTEAPLWISEKTAGVLLAS